MPPYAITCPGCRRPLRVPAEAVGKPAHCPECKANFFLPANADGSPGEPQVAARRRGFVGVYKPLAGPGVALTILALIGLFVNGRLLLLFSLDPGAALQYARTQVQELHQVEELEALKAAGRPKPAEPPPPDPEAVKRRAAEQERDEALAVSWAPWMRPLHRFGVVVSLVELLGGVSILRGRLYAVALIGCAAGVLNVGYLCCVPSGVAGVWGVLFLVRDDARQYFRRP